MALKKKKIHDYSAKNLLDSVVAGYDLFANEWHTTRQHNWYEFSLFAKLLLPTDSVLDVGCGNARLYPFLQDVLPTVQYTGIDASAKLIDIARTEYPLVNAQVGNALALPHEQNTFNAVASFAVLHHITPQSNRQQFFAEIARVLKPGSIAFVTVWNLHQPKYAQYLRGDLCTRLWNIARSPCNAPFGLRDCRIPFGQQKTLRYVHAFTPKELQRLAAPLFTVESTHFTLKDGLTSNWQECRNICLVLRKR
jgi:ubiquinone/menaquinone biosynthesis C-methylase UbiE